MYNRLIFTIVFALFVFGVSTAQITGKVQTESTKTKYKANTVVYIEKAGGNFKPPAKHAEMDQKKLVFIPRVLPVLAGTTVDFLNNDDVLHNVFSPDKCSKFDLGSYGKGVTKSYKFDKEGCQPVILCNVHPEMEAYIVVLQNPYFAVTDNEGNYSIKGVPAGKYTLKIWNEKLKALPKEITVPASGKLEVNFDIKK